jgi:hypothetical protein
MKTVLTVSVTINGDQRAEVYSRAERAATDLLNAAHKVEGYFGSTVEVGEPQ